MRYRNSEGYADPTAGMALEHIAEEERRKRRLAKKKRRETRKRMEAAFRKEARKAQAKDAYKSNDSWTLAWSSADVSTKRLNGGN